MWQKLRFKAKTTRDAVLIHAFAWPHTFLQSLRLQGRVVSAASGETQASPEERGAPTTRGTRPVGCTRSLGPSLWSEKQPGRACTPARQGSQVCVPQGPRGGEGQRVGQGAVDDAVGGVVQGQRPPRLRALHHPVLGHPVPVRHCDWCRMTGETPASGLDTDHAFDRG